MEKADLAVQYKRSMNCCQAVLCAFADALHMDTDTLCKLGAGFGSGMGTTGATCGALCGAQMVLGMLGTAPVMPHAKQLYQQFEARCGSTLCRELKASAPEKFSAPATTACEMPHSSQQNSSPCRQFRRKSSPQTRARETVRAGSNT